MSIHKQLATLRNQVWPRVKYSLNKRYHSLTCGLQPDISHRDSHLHKSKKNGMLDQSLRQVAKMCGNYFIREAMPSDKEDVLNIRKNLYGGLDYMPDCYDKLVSIPNGKAFVAIHEDKVLWFKFYDPPARLIEQMTKYADILLKEIIGLHNIEKSHCNE